MGKEWLYWVGGRSGGGRSSTKRGKISGEMKEADTSAGCMCAVLHLFDLHHFQFASIEQKHPDFRSNYPFLQEEAITSKGVEAPRNSLELESATINAASMLKLAMTEEDENLRFPVGIQIKTGHGKISSPRVSTSASKSRLCDFSSDCSSNSPGTKSPSLVARLMGLDFFPECNSPSISSSSHKKSRFHQQKERNLLRSRSSRSFFDDDDVGFRSLPETPRISSAGRSDDEHRRLSLQISKENTNEEFALADKKSAGRGRFRLQPQDENTSPGQYAKQIVKNVKDSVSRRVGLDITNTIYRNREYYRRDENLNLLKPTKKNSKISSQIEGQINPDCNQSNTPFCSPKLKFLDHDKSKTTTTNGAIKNSRISSSSENHQSQATTNSTKPVPQVIKPLQAQQQQKDGKKVESTEKRGSSRLRNKKEEQFVRSTATNKLSFADKKPKRIPSSSDVLNISGATLLQVRKYPSPPPTKLPQKQSQVSYGLSSKSSTHLSSNLSQQYKQQQLQPDKIFTLPETILPATTNGCTSATPGGFSAQYGDYIQRILERAGIINNINPLASTKWHSPSHPIDPSIFHHLELFYSTSTKSVASDSGGCNSVLDLRCNRKLIFQLVGELLTEVLTPHFILNPRVSPICEDGHFSLVDKLYKKIDGFPAANCLVLEDIDSLIDKDLHKSHLNVFVYEEENTVCEIEDEIVEWLVRETVAEMGGDAAVEKTETYICHVGLSCAKSSFSRFV